MGSVADAFALAFRDYTTVGVPASGAHEPDKTEIRAIGVVIEQVLAASGLNKIYETTAAGIAGTVDGNLFLVKGAGNEFAVLYKNVAGAAVSQNISLPSTALFDTKANLAGPRFQKGAGGPDTVGGLVELAAPVDSDLKGPVGLEVQGNRLFVYIRGGTGGNVYIDFDRLFAGVSLSLVPVNPAFTDYTVRAADLPSAFPRQPAQYEVTSGDGWPTFGYLLSFVSGSAHRGVQFLFSDGDFPTRAFVRVAKSNADDWLPWVPFGGPALAASGPWNFNSGSGVNLPTDPNIINGLIDWGQSNREGNNGVAQALIADEPLNATTAQYVLMGNCGARFNLRVGNVDKGQPTGPIFTDFVPCHEAIDVSTQCYETPLTSAMTHIHQWIFDATGTRTTWAGVTIARGGYRSDELAQGRGAFEYTRQWVSDAVAAASRKGKKFILRDIFWRSNESDTTAGTDSEILANTLIGLAKAANAEFSAITGQTVDIRFWLDSPQDPRCPDFQNGDRIYHNVIEAQRIAYEKSDLIYLSAPYYQHLRSNADQQTHLSARGMNNSGVDDARLLLDVLANRYAPAQPYRARVSNPARTEITVYCPYTPAIDTSGAIVAVAGIPGYGGIYLDDAGGATITGYSIVGKKIVFTTSAPVAASGSRLLVGLLPNQAENPISGNVFGPQTGLRTIWYFAGRDMVNLFTGDTIRDWFRSCVLDLG